jgi:hypothetical protein
MEDERTCDVAATLAPLDTKQHNVAQLLSQRETAQWMHKAINFE